ncbi:MAG TPA: acetyl-CoA hydrolase/transferase C-terminal domain-containing protein [Anaerovoracaceae bacterium]|nr:acetyl-CoA hydrolase/transferase C-terminal domain-containing protein [Anaerovoracaceae bacterium]
MMTIKELYNSKLCPASEAVGHIKSGDYVVVAHACAEPPVLIDAMVENYAAYEDVKFIHMVSQGEGKQYRPEYRKHFKYEGFFLGAGTRETVACGHSNFIPAYLHQVPDVFRTGAVPCDVCIVMLSRPDSRGRCFIGVSCDYTVQAMRSAKIIIAECNDFVPRTPGEDYIHVDELDYIVETSHEVKELPPPAITETEYRIAEHCASLVRDGATLQLGIGAIPNAVMGLMKEKKDLGIHSEMISDWVVDLVGSGVINGSRKSINKNKIVATFMMGTKKLYDFADNNKMIELRTSDYVNNPAVVAKNSNMVSINGAMEVDLMGQVSAESIGLRQFSGIGGQLDFFRGVAMSADGKGIGIVAMPSVAAAKDGTKISKIVPFLREGSAVTTPRTDVDYVVTEYGIAHLKWHTLKDRAKALIKIAHPDFRDELKAEYEKRFCEIFSTI